MPISGQLKATEINAFYSNGIIRCSFRRLCSCKGIVVHTIFNDHFHYSLHIDIDLLLNLQVKLATEFDLSNILVGSRF